MPQGYRKDGSKLGFQKGHKFSKENLPNKGSFKKGQHYSPKTEFKKGTTIGKKYWFKKGIHNNLEYEIKKGQHISPKTEFKKGQNLGNEHPHWKGGKYKNKQGYVFIYKPTHPFCNKQGYILKHRFVIEKYIGRYLKPDEVVHHINGNPSDNRFKNLKLFINQKEHARFHKLIPNK